MPLMWVIVGIWLGLVAMAHIWVVAGPIIALLNFVVGRFFVASVIMAISLYCGTMIWPDLVVGADEYKVLLGAGLALEAVKWFITQRWRREQGSHSSGSPVSNIVINVLDDPPVMRDVTPRVRRIR